MISCELIERFPPWPVREKIVTVNSKVEQFAYDEGVTSITPNRSEAENAIRNIKITHRDGRKLGLNSDRLQSLADVERAGTQLLKFLKLDSLLITLGEQGMYIFEKGKKSEHIHTRVQEVFDVTGAGDTVIAVFTLALTAGASSSRRIWPTTRPESSSERWAPAVTAKSFWKRPRSYESHRRHPTRWANAL